MLPSNSSQSSSFYFSSCIQFDLSAQLLLTSALRILLSNQSPLLLFVAVGFGVILFSVILFGSSKNLVASSFIVLIIAPFVLRCCIDLLNPFLDNMFKLLIKYSRCFQASSSSCVGS